MFQDHWEKGLEHESVFPSTHSRYKNRASIKKFMLHQQNIASSFTFGSITFAFIMKVIVYF